VATKEIGRQRRQTFVMVLGAAVFNRHILALDIAGFFQALAKGGQAQRIVEPLGRGAEEPDHRHCRLLRARRERPRRRAAEQRDELTPSYVTCHAPLPRRHAPVKQYYTVIRSFASVARWPLYLCLASTFGRSRAPSKGLVRAYTQT
jgi:hypothetical protein